MKGLKVATFVAQLPSDASVMKSSPLLAVRDLSVSFKKGQGTAEVLCGLSFEVAAGEAVGIVGESGEGKTALALSVMGLLPPEAVVNGRVLFEGEPFSARLRGCRVAMVFQEPATALHPLFRCGYQVEEVLLAHGHVRGRAARREVLSLLERVQLEEPERISCAYPHELSGGQRQRVLIAMALAGRPQLLIADEPTTALDGITQQSILRLLAVLRREEGLALLLISHDLGVISHVADRLLLLRQGRVLEAGSTATLLERPQHPYTRGLLACRPQLGRRLLRLPTLAEVLQAGAAYRPPPEVESEELARRRARLYAQTPLVRLSEVGMRYALRRYFWAPASQWVDALSDIGMEVFPGEVLGVAGASGSGKSTLGRILAFLQLPTSGSVQYRGLPVRTLHGSLYRQIRREVQLVFQDPYRSLNPRQTIGEAVGEPLKVHRLCTEPHLIRRAAAELLEQVGLSAEVADRRPHELSGGQRQRVCLARALATRPRLLVLDEITSALDVSVQADILNLLLDLQRDFGLTYVLISHDMSVLYQMCDRVLVLHQGRMEALDTPEKLFAHPPTPYVRQLMAASLR